jgi:hypothetical protein
MTSVVPFQILFVKVIKRSFGRAIAQAISRCFPLRRHGYDSGSGQVGFVVDKVALGQVFSEYLCFPCQSSFHRLLHNHHHLSSEAGTIGQTVAAVPSEICPTPKAIRKKKVHSEASNRQKVVQLFPIAPTLENGATENTFFHFIFLILGQSIGLFGQGISPSQGRYLHREQHKHRIGARRYTCLENYVFRNLIYISSRKTGRQEISNWVFANNRNLNTQRRNS